MTMDGTSAGKIAIARRELGTALALFLNDLDPVSVHVLAATGCEIIEGVAKKAGKEVYFDDIRTTFSHLNECELRGSVRKYLNAFKHFCNRKGEYGEDTEILESFSDEINDHILFMGWLDYLNATGKLPIEVQVFRLWYFAMYPRTLTPDSSKETR